MIPFTNALCISYTQAGFSINYGAARGFGAAASAVSSLVLGFVIAQLGSTWMIMLLVFFRVLSIVMTLVGTIIIFTTVTKKDTMKVIPYEAN